MSFCCPARKCLSFFFFFSRSYRDLSYKDFLITFHPFFALVTSYWKKSPFSVVLATVLQGAAGGCAVPRPGGSEEMLMIRACTNGLMSKWKVYFQWGSAEILVEPGLPCDCAVNTAVLSRREPAQHRETLSSLLLLIEKPIAIYLLTLDIESIPRGAAPAKPLLGSP